MASTRDEEWTYLERMLLIRRFEEAILRLATEKQFVGHYHLYIGQEATAVPIMGLLRPADRLTTTHRNHGHVLARGADPRACVAEILGRAEGLSGGRGGTIHLSDPDLGFLSTSGIVGGGISLGMGAGYAAKRKNDGSIAVAFFGDGALEEGVSYESLNIASLWKLPVLFVCENNSTGSWAPGEGYPTLVHASTDLGSVARALGIRTVRVDGADTEAVRTAAEEAVAQCRSGGGPVFFETMTKRWPGNNPLWPELVTGNTDVAVMTGERTYTGDHADWVEGHDPVVRLARRLAADGPEAVVRIKELDRRVSGEIERAVAAALVAPMPDPSTARDRVFA
jgi:pyruvate dehydrogenase E1 component alpha subunit